MTLERDAALREIDTALATDQTSRAADLASAVDGPRAQMRWAAAASADSAVAVDEVIMTLEAILGGEEPLPPAEELAAHCLRVDSYVRKRIRPLAERALQDARDAGFAEAPRLAISQGRLHHRFDERAAAQECFSRALVAFPKHVEAVYASADLYYVLGEFSAAFEAVGAICTAQTRSTDCFADSTEPTHAQWAKALRLQASIHAALGANDKEAALWRTLLQSEHGDSPSDRLSLAFAAAGDYDGAALELRAICTAKPDSGLGRYARKRLDYLTAEDVADAPVMRLKQFPTTAQKHNYCGPAVLELCLSFLDLELSQDEIADVVKREHGTPMFEICAFLQHHNIESRRIEATPEKIRTAIDLGLPVIVQEEYSTTSHVAVVTGYDAKLGVFIANDPATHRPLVKAFEWTERSSDLFGNGGVLVLGRRGSATTGPLIERADEAGLLEEKHLVLLDTADKQRQKLESDRGPDVANQEVIAICDNALEMQSHFRLAWFRKLRSLYSLFLAHQTAHSRELFTDFLHRARVTFPFDEWTHQMHGHFLEACDRHHEAFVEFLEASRIDASDSDNLQSMGECRHAGGDLTRAERYMLEAIALDPAHVRAIENLAAVYVRQLEELAEHELDENLFSTRSKSEELSVPIEKEHGEIAARARYFSHVAVAARPENPFNHYVAGSAATYLGELEPALESYREAVRIDAERPHAKLAAAHVLLALGRAEEARAFAETLTDEARGWSESWLLLADTHRALGDANEAKDALVRGAGVLQSDREELVEPLFEASRAVLHSKEAAGSVVRELAEGHWNDAAFMRSAAYTLDREGQRGHAIALMRHVLAQAPDDLQTIYRLGSLLSEDVTTKDEGRLLLEKACEYAPDSPVVRVKLAWLSWPDEAGTGLEVLAPVLEAEDPNVYETAAALRRAAGDDAGASSMRRLAVGSFRSEVQAHLRLGWWHINANRYELALEHALALREIETDGDEATEAEDLDYSAHRLAGKVSELLPRAVARCKDEVPEHLAWDVYYSFRSVEPRLAARAALVVAADQEDDDERRQWRAHAAGRFALAGDGELLDSIEDEIASCGPAWASLSWEYAELDRFEDANRAADRGFALEPENLQVLAAVQEAELRRGDLEQAMTHATRALELYPYQHIGNERLALLLGKQLDADGALTNSHRAIDLAPFCHVSLNSHAVSLVVAGEVSGAVVYAERSLGLEPVTEEDEDNDALMIVRAAAGDVEGLTRCIENHRTAYPAELFGRYHEHLLEIARSRSSSRGSADSIKPGSR